MSESSKSTKKSSKFSYDQDLEKLIQFLQEEFQKEEISTIMVELVVYNINPQFKWLRYFGIGIHHTAIKIGNYEVAYGYHPEKETGVYITEYSRSIPEPASILYTKPVKEQSLDKVFDAIRETSKKWLGCDYNMTQKNCNHYTADLMRKLCGKNLPLRYNNAARVYEGYLRCKRFFACAKRPDISEEEEQLIRSIKETVTRDMELNLERKDLHEVSEEKKSSILS